MIESLPGSSSTPPAHRIGPSARLAAARILVREGEERWQDVERHLLHLWQVDSEED
jgi:hypothetical protein